MQSTVNSDLRAYQSYINGEWSESRSGKTFPVYDPSTEEIIAHVAEADSADVDYAVKSARAAFDCGRWPATTAQERGRILFRLAAKVRDHAAMLADIEARNGGKPIVEAEGDIRAVITVLEYYGANQWVWPGRSYLGTIRCSWPPGSLGRRWRLAALAF
jgi:acyl-CoA reductase-like NAD-dependent aldehyde dehydrogenase